jgi:hypothetical protein
MGLYEKLDDMKSKESYNRINESLQSIASDPNRTVDDVINSLKASMV